jgi:hypothetical protein
MVGARGAAIESQRADFPIGCRSHSSQQIIAHDNEKKIQPPK